MTGIMENCAETLAKEFADIIREGVAQFRDTKGNVLGSFIVSPEGGGE